MKKIKYNARIMKKSILILVLAAVVFIFGFGIVKSFISTEITTDSKQLVTSIPAGDYREYLLTKLGLDVNIYDDSRESDVKEFATRLDNAQPKTKNPIVLSYETAKIVAGGDGFVKDKSYLVDGAEVKGYYTDDSGALQWEFDVPTAGFYYINLDYIIPSKSGSANSGSNAERALYVNDVLLFDALGSLNFYRVYRDNATAIEFYLKNGELPVDLKGNNLKPSQEEVPNVRRQDFLQDDTGYVQDPYLVYFNAGVNTLKLESIREELVVFNISVCQTADYTVETYENYVAKHEANGAKLATGYIKTYEAEDSSIRKSSSPTLYPISDRNSSANTPSDPVLQKYNAVGGSKWSNAGEYLEWTINVPEDGFYHIAFRTKQDLSRGLFTTRKLYVNGEVPFREAENCRFYYDSKYSITKLGDSDGNAFKVYLQKGDNAIKLKATVGDYGNLISQVQLVVDDLNDLYLRIISITTANPDEYQEYNLYGENARLEPDSKGRTMEDIFSDAAKTLNNVSKQLTEITGEKSTYNNTLDELVLQIGDEIDGKKIEGFAANPRNVTKDLAAFKTNLSALGTWVLDIKNQSLTIESFTIYTEDNADNLPKSEDNFFASFWYSVVGFFKSFVFDYEAVGVTTEAQEREIEVWYLSDASSGREQCNAIKSIIDQTFIPETGINVVLKIVAPGVLLPATLAGTGPDVAINVDGGLPVNYALRGAVYDMSLQDDFEQTVNERFTKEQMVPFSLLHADGSVGYYGFPNTMSFYVMFYRTDIFEKRGWEVPKTWDDVVDLVTDMQVSNLQFYMPLEGDGGTMFATLLYQSGGQYYVDDQTSSAFYDEVALKTFEQWCSFFTDYSFELAANFSNRFRSGEMPIGIASYTLFNTLAVFAPDIAGKWAFAPLPGQIVVPDNPATIENELVVNNSTMLGQTAVVIMKKSTKYDDSWEFIKWWTRTDTQTIYAKEMESILGSAARHNTANRFAIENLAWTTEEVKIITQMWDTAVGIPGVPGGYYIGRNLENSIRSVINNDTNPRETFKEYIEQIDSEITRKREEFGLPIAK